VYQPLRYVVTLQCVLNVTLRGKVTVIPTVTLNGNVTVIPTFTLHGNVTVCTDLNWKIAQMKRGAIRLVEPSRND
jgi:hypothetical protein